MIDNAIACARTDFTPAFADPRGETNIGVIAAPIELLAQLLMAPRVMPEGSIADIAAHQWTC